MIILSCDTSFGIASTSVIKEGKVISFISESERSMQAEFLANQILQCLTDADLSLEDIDSFSASIGPGSFTGVRIGVSTLKAISYASKKDFLGVLTTESLANKYFSNHESKNVYCCMNAGKSQLYVQKFSDRIINSNIDEVSNIEYDELGKLIKENKKDDFIFNNEKDLKKIKESLSDEDSKNLILDVYDARDIGLACLNLLNLNEGELKIKTGERALPIYVRGADAIKPKRKVNLNIDF